MSTFIGKVSVLLRTLWQWKCSNGSPTWQSFRKYGVRARKILLRSIVTALGGHKAWYILHEQTWSHIHKEGSETDDSEHENE